MDSNKRKLIEAGEFELKKYGKTVKEYYLYLLANDKECEGNPTKARNKTTAVFNISSASFYNYVKN